MKATGVICDGCEKFVPVKATPKDWFSVKRGDLDVELCSARCLAKLGNQISRLENPTEVAESKPRSNGKKDAAGRRKLVDGSEEQHQTQHKYPSQKRPDKCPLCRKEGWE